MATFLEGSRLREHCASGQCAGALAAGRRSLRKGVRPWPLGHEKWRLASNRLQRPAGLRDSAAKATGKAILGYLGYRQLGF